jgi:hypothetical protein
MIHTGQTGRPFSSRFREHYRDYTLGKYNSKFSEHLLKHHRSFGPIETIMDLCTLHIQRQADEHYRKVSYIS